MNASGSSHRFLIGLFFLSGIPALLYQVVWQRALFAIFGVNVESVAVVVAAFMLGLGLGALAGGRLSRSSLPLLGVFGAIELGIGAYGAVSLPLFRGVGAVALGWPAAATAVTMLALVFLPTLLMGATLPVLAAYLVGRSGHVGRSVGALYAANTWGGAAACFLGALVLMRSLGMQGVVLLAAGMNAATGAGAILLARRERGASAAPAELPTAPPRRLPFAAGLALAAGAGFVSLSYEIVWFRILSFASQANAVSFAATLGCTLAGIAAGAQAARRHCSGDPARALSTAALLSVTLGLPLIPAVSFLAGAGLGYLFWALAFAALQAALLGALFPLISHAVVAPDARAGRGLGFVATANIAGAAAGSLLTGFVFLDLLELRFVALGLTLAGVALAAALVGRRRGRAAILAGVSVAAVAGNGLLFDGFHDRLFFKGSGCLKEVVENRHGVVAVDGEDRVYGEGVYDGAFRPLDLRYARPFMLSAFHPGPRRVLVIGLGTGSWARIVAHHPAVERMTAVEINPAYLDLIRSRPTVAPLLSDPRVRVVIDDGRRWLGRHPEERFDLILSNTTVDYRVHASNLLSVEFLERVRRHLAPGGILAYNASNSSRAMHTGCRVFPHGYRLFNFMVMSDAPLRVDPSRLRSVLAEYRIDGRPVGGDLAALAALARPGTGADAPVEERAGVLARTSRFPVITDDNMGNEWRVPPRGEPLIEGLIAWLKERGIPDWLRR